MTDDTRPREPLPLTAGMGVRATGEAVEAVRFALIGAFHDYRDADGDELYWTNEEAVDFIGELQEHGFDIATLDAARRDAPDAADGPFIAYFTTHGEGWIVTDRERPGPSRIAVVDTSPGDYGRANTLAIADALNAAARTEDTGAALRTRQAAVMNGWAADPQFHPATRWLSLPVALAILNGTHPALRTDEPGGTPE